MPPQLGLFDGPPSAPLPPPGKPSRLAPGCVDDHRRGAVLHPARTRLATSIRIMGRDASGAWVCRVCDRAGKDVVPYEVLVLPRERLP